MAGNFGGEFNLVDFFVLFFVLFFLHTCMSIFFTVFLFGELYHGIFA